MDDPGVECAANTCLSECAESASPFVTAVKFLQTLKGQPGWTTAHTQQFVFEVLPVLHNAQERVRGRREIADKISSCTDIEWLTETRECWAQFEQMEEQVQLIDSRLQELGWPETE